jgi:VanZ family protein
LGLLLYREFNGGLKVSLGWNKAAAFKALLEVAVYAIYDEVHQLFVPGSQFSLIDLAIDIMAIACVLPGMKVIMKKMSKR